MAAQNSAARGSSVLDFSSGATPAISTSAWRTLKRVVFTAADLSKPDGLYNVLYKVQDLLFQGLGPVTQNAIVPSNRCTGITFTAGGTVNIPHGLGRAYVGWFCVRAQGGYPSFQEVAIPSGMDASQVLPLMSANAGTFDLLVF